jgi:hypothetical protein
MPPRPERPPPRAIAPSRAERWSASCCAAIWRCHASNRARWARSPASSAVAAVQLALHVGPLRGDGGQLGGLRPGGLVGHRDGLVGGRLGRDRLRLPGLRLVQRGAGGGVGVGLVHPRPLQRVLRGELGAGDGVVELGPGHQVLGTGGLGEQREWPAVELLLVGGCDEVVQPVAGLVDGRGRGLGLDPGVGGAAGRGRRGVLRRLHVDQRRLGGLPLRGQLGL